MTSPKNRSVKRAVLRLKTGILQVDFIVNGDSFKAVRNSGRLFIMEKDSQYFQSSKSFPWSMNVSPNDLIETAKKFLIEDVMGA